MKSNRFLFALRVTFVCLLAVLATGCLPPPPRPGGFQRTPGSSSGLTPAVAVADQNYDGTTVVVADVVSNGPGWMVIHNQKNGTIGASIGFARLTDGDNQNVRVKIDPNQATPVLYAMLHVDRGEVGKYEYPGPDEPVMLNGQMLSPAFKANASGKTPAQGNVLVEVQSQLVQAGKVTIKQVESVGPGWIAIYTQNPDGTRGDPIGYTAVKPGKNENLTIFVDPARMTKVLYAALHTDDGEIGTYEIPRPDAPVVENGIPVAKSFTSDGSPLAQQLTPVSTQAIAQVNATQTPDAQSTSAIATAVIEATAAVIAAITAAAEATAGTAAGAPTSTMAGSVEPEVTSSTADTSEFPTNTPSPDDAPQITVDHQPLSGSLIRLDQVYSKGPGWVVIFTLDSTGQPDKQIGRVAVEDGGSRDVLVLVDPARAAYSAGKTLYAQLHADDGDVGIYEYPGPDSPVMINLVKISSRFKITIPLAAPTITPTDEPNQLADTRTPTPDIHVTTPAVTETTPWVTETTPPVTETTPPVVETTPPVVETTPPVVETTPPVVETTPPPPEVTDPPPPPPEVTDPPPPPPADTEPPPPPPADTSQPAPEPAETSAEPSEP